MILIAGRIQHPKMEEKKSENAREEPISELGQVFVAKIASELASIKHQIILEVVTVERQPAGCFISLATFSLAKALNLSQSC